MEAKVRTSHPQEARPAIILYRLHSSRQRRIMEHRRVLFSHLLISVPSMEVWVIQQDQVMEAKVRTSHPQEARPAIILYRLHSSRQRRIMEHRRVLFSHLLISVPSMEVWVIQQDQVVEPRLTLRIYQRSSRLFTQIHRSFTGRVRAFHLTPPMVR